MPDGATHYRIWKDRIPLAVVVGTTVGILDKDPLVAVGFISGYLMGRYVDPDADLIGVTSSEGRLMRELKIFGVLLTMWLFPYAYLMRFVGLNGRKGHRNFFSHFPIVGTLIRYIWIFGLPMFLYWWYIADFPIWFPAVVLSSFSGLCLADIFHWVADMDKGD